MIANESEKEKLINQENRECVNCEHPVKISWNCIFGREQRERDKTRLKGIRRGKVAEHHFLFDFAIS